MRRGFWAALLAALALAGCAPAGASGSSSPPASPASSPSSAASSPSRDPSGPSSQVGSAASLPAGAGDSSGPEAPEGCRWLTITEAEVLTFINKERKSLGLAPLTYDGELAEAARDRCRELYLGDYVAHTRPDGEPWETVLEEAGVEYALAAENLAWSNHALGESLSAFQWFSLWKESPGHYEAMTSPLYTHCGIAALAGPYFEGEEQTYLAAVFCSY